MQMLKYFVSAAFAVATCSSIYSYSVYKQQVRDRVFVDQCMAFNTDFDKSVHNMKIAVDALAAAKTANNDDAAKQAIIQEIAAVGEMTVAVQRFDKIQKAQEHAQ
jgi:hypothetical protein